MLQIIPIVLTNLKILTYHILHYNNKQNKPYNTKDKPVDIKI